MSRTRLKSSNFPSPHIYLSTIPKCTLHRDIYGRKASDIRIAFCSQPHADPRQRPQSITIHTNSSRPCDPSIHTPSSHIPLPAPQLSSRTPRFTTHTQSPRLHIPTSTATDPLASVPEPWELDHYQPHLLTRQIKGCGNPKVWTPRAARTIFTRFHMVEEVWEFTPSSHFPGHRIETSRHACMRKAKKIGGRSPRLLQPHIRSDREQKG